MGITQTENLKYAFGITSNCEDNTQVVFIDFDDIYLTDVYDTLLDMQKKYKLNNFYLLKSTNGFNAFCLSKRNFEDIVTMLKEYDKIDQKYVELQSKYRGFFTLRMGEDKIHIDTLKNYNNDNLSYAHYLFFTRVMNFDLDFNGKYDNLSGFNMIAFKQKKHGWVYFDD